jgi:hypothetical protein
VALATEFGCTPRINGADGRDHHNRAFTWLLAEVGIESAAIGDTHSDNFEGTPQQAAVLGQAMSALLPASQETVGPYPDLG